MWIKCPLLLAACCMLLTTLSVQSAEPSTQPVLRWQAVAGAHEYEIEVETPDGKAVKRQRTKGTSITLILDPGDYRVRILVLNRFGKTASTGKWSPLVVRRSEDATLRLVEPATVYADETGRRVILHGGHFYPGTSITLEAADGTLTPLSVEIRSEEEATVLLPRQRLAEGTCAIIIENRPGKRVRFAGRLAVIDRERIEASGFSPPAAFSDRPIDLHVRGRFPEGCLLSLHGPLGEIPVIPVSVKATNLTARLEAGKLAPAEYRVLLRTPRGGQVGVTGTLTIRRPPQIATLVPKQADSLEQVRFLLTGSGLAGIRDVLLLPPDGSLPVKAGQLEPGGDGRLAFTVSVPDALPGTYRLELAYPDGLRRTLTDSIEVGRKDRLELLAVNPTRITTMEAEAQVVLDGNNFHPRMQVRLERPGFKRNNSRFTFESPSRVRVAFPVFGLPEARYDIVLTDPRGKEYRFEGKIQLLPVASFVPSGFFPRQIFADQAAELLVQGKQPTAGTRVLLKSGERAFRPERQTILENGLLIGLPPGALAAGEWHLVVQQPGLPGNTLPETLAVFSPPQAETFTPAALDIPQKTTLLVSGKGFSGMDRAQLIGPDGRSFPASAATVQGPEHIEITVDLTGGKPGLYKLACGYPGGISRTNELTLPVGTATADPVAGETPPAQAFTIGVGTILTTALGEYGKLFAGLSVPGFSIHASMDLPFLGFGDPASPASCFGIGIEFDRITLSMTSLAGDPAMTVHTTSGLLYWRSNRSGPLALIPRIGAGYGWTESTRSDSAETRMGAGTIFQAGLFLEWTPLWSLAVEFGFDFRYSMFPDPLSALHPRLRLGWKF